MTSKLVLTGVLSALGALAVAELVRLLKKYYKDQKDQNSDIEKKNLMDLVGNTPMIYLKSLSEDTKCHIFAKMEYLNPGGSVKDRLAKQLILDAEADQKLQKEGDRIYEGTSANFNRYQTVLFLPDDLSEEKYRSLEICGAEIRKVRPVSIVDSSHYCKLAENESQNLNAFFSDQFENLSNFKVHYTTTGPEIYEQTKGKVNAFICSSGTGGTISGVSRYLKKKNPNVKIVLADPPGSSLSNRINYGVLYTHEEAEGHRVRHPFDTVTEGVGLNRLTSNFEKAKIDKAFKIPDDQTLRMARYLIEREGLFVGASSAMNCVAAVKTARMLGEGNVIVTILCDSGSRYLTKFYSKPWLEKYDKKLASVIDERVTDLSFVK